MTRYFTKSLRLIVPIIIIENSSSTESEFGSGFMDGFYYYGNVYKNGFNYMVEHPGETGINIIKNSPYPGNPFLAISIRESIISDVQYLKNYYEDNSGAKFTGRVTFELVVLTAEAYTAKGTLRSLTGSAKAPLKNVPEGASKTAIDINKLNSKPLYRVMTESELNAVKETGYLRGGREGTTYFTDSYYMNASNAQTRLSLPNKPEYIVEFKITNNPTVTGGNTVKAAYGGSGGGREYFSDNPVQIDIINYQKMK